MFSSLASFLFGSSTNETNNYDALEKEQNGYLPHEKQFEAQCNKDSKVNESRALTSQTTRNSLKNEFQQELEERNKGKKRKNKNNSKQAQVLEYGTHESIGDDFDLIENDWFFVEDEDVKIPNSLSRAVVEEGFNIDANYNRASTPVLEVSNTAIPELKTSKHQKLKKDSHQIRNCNRRKPNRNSKSRDTNTRSYYLDSCNEVCTSSLSSSGSFPKEKGVNGTVDVKALANGDITHSLYVVPGSQESGHNVSGASCDSNSSGAKLFTMVDSWYLTPPPCFTSNGPIHMEITPFENLLIEHPSMSVYHSIRSSQKVLESFVNFDLEINESKVIQMERKNRRMPPTGQQKNEEKENSKPQEPPQQNSLTTKRQAASIGQKFQSTLEGRTSDPRIDRCAAAQLKMELFARNGQKSEANRNKQNLRRSAILRSNQVREMQSKGNRQRRADLQHCRLSSGVNNNRKCCY